MVRFKDMNDSDQAKYIVGIGMSIGGIILVVGIIIRSVLWYLGWN